MILEVSWDGLWTLSSGSHNFMVTWTINKNHILSRGMSVPNTIPRDHGTPKSHNRWFIIFYCVWAPAWIEIHWNSIRLRARSHMTSHYTWEPMTTIHDFGGVLGRPFDTFFWALTLLWSRLLARVWGGPKSPWPVHFKHSRWLERRRRSKFALHTTLEGPTEYVNAIWM